MQIESALSVIPSDDRELWVKLGHAAKTLDEGGEGQGKRAWLKWSSKSPKFDLEDAERVWSSISPTNTSHEQVFKTAVDLGWDVQAENIRIHSTLGWVGMKPQLVKALSIKEHQSQMPKTITPHKML